MSLFQVHEIVETLNGVVVRRQHWTTCNVCGGLLKSAQEWSRHRSMHTPITERDLQCHIPQHILDANK